MFDLVDICRIAQTVMTSIVYSSEAVKLSDGAHILFDLFVWFGAVGCLM